MQLHNLRVSCGGEHSINDIGTLIAAPPAFHESGVDIDDPILLGTSVEVEATLLAAVTRGGA